MKCYFRVSAAIVLATIVSLPSFASASPREQGREKAPIGRMVQKIRKFFGIVVHEDIPVPPPPTKPS